ncbi:sigma-70 family RNA polymerase sigma factor [soil metagenome]
MDTPPPDPERFLSLLRPLERELEIYARRMTSSVDLGSDALQNAVLKAFRHFDRYHPEASFRAWIYTILTNEIRAMNRSRRKIECRELPAEEEMLGAVSGEPSLWSCWDGDEDALYERLDDGVVRALQSLSVNERAVLLLRGVADLQYRDIAETLGIPMGSVMGHLSRARQKTREALLRQTNRRKRSP